MLDLEKMEKDLDNALESETKESLTELILNQRIELEAWHFYQEEIEGEPLTEKIPIDCFIAGAKSNASKEYWFAKFIKQIIK